MKIQYISKKLLFSVVLAATLSSCSEDKMDEINKDVNNNTTNVPAKFILTDVMTSTAYRSVSGDFTLYGGIYVEHETGSHNQFYSAELRTTSTLSSTFNNSWGSIYRTLKDAKIAIEKCSEGGAQEGFYITRGIAEVLAAYNLALTTDMFGDTPWKEACDYTVSMAPAIDKQEDIYKDVFAYLDAAIEDLQKSDLVGSIGKQDLIYSGDAKKWLKTAYGLKARYTMRLVARSANVSADMENVLDYVSKSYTSEKEQCSYNMYKDDSAINPFFGVYGSRKGEVASKSLFDKLVERNDPRVRRCYMEPKSHTMIASAQDSLVNFAVNGNLEQSQKEYTTSMFVAAQTAPTHLLSYHEILFLKAEALTRLGRNDDAKDVLKDAVVASMANMENNVSAALNTTSTWWEGGFKNVTDAVSEDEAEEFFDNNIASLFAANPLKEVMIQKYISFWNANGESTECYNDVRRMKALGQDVYGFANPGKFPLRCPYGNSDTTTNPNVQAAYGDGQYVWTENVWWAGGSR